jgi:hypothetical protein
VCVEAQQRPIQCAPNLAKAGTGMHRIQHINIASEVINGKPVFTFDSHHEALLPWAQCARDLGISPRLLTLDYHRETRPAFIAHSVVDIAADIGDEDWESRAAVKVGKIDIRDENTHEI